MNLNQESLDLREGVIKAEPDLVFGTPQNCENEQDDVFDEFETFTPIQNSDEIKQEIMEHEESQTEQRSDLESKTDQNSMSKVNVQFFPTTIKKELGDIKEDINEYVQSNAGLFTHCDLQVLKNENTEYPDGLPESCDEQNEKRPNLLKNNKNCLKSVKRRRYICRKNFPTSNSKLNQHGQFRKRRVICKFCGKIIKKINLQTHLLIHTNGTPFKCDICSKEFIYKTSLITHLKFHNKIKPFKCNICTKEFKIKCHLQAHLLTHTNEKPFKCDICSKEFNHISNLHRHLIIHTNEKRFKCNICSKEFNRKSSLQTHEIIHTNKKPFKCHICSKGYSQNYPLQQHLITHSGEKPFKCDICSNGFSRRDHLQRHLTIHTNV